MYLYNQKNFGKIFPLFFHRIAIEMPNEHRAMNSIEGLWRIEIQSIYIRAFFHSVGDWMDGRDLISNICDDNSSKFLPRTDKKKTQRKLRINFHCCRIFCSKISLWYSINFVLKILIDRNETISFSFFVVLSKFFHFCFGTNTIYRWNVILTILLRKSIASRCFTIFNLQRKIENGKVH